MSLARTATTILFTVAWFGVTSCSGEQPAAPSVSEPPTAVVGGAAPIGSEAGWTSPDGRFQIAYPPDWGLIEDPNAPADVLANFGQTTPVVTRTECFATGITRTDFTGQSQMQINDAVLAWTQGRALSHAGGAALSRQVVEYKTETVDRVAVATLIVDVNAGDEAFRYYSRQFVLEQNGAATFHAVNCMSELGAGPDNAANQALAGSLRFIR